jgi:hypothetical protein
MPRRTTAEPKKLASIPWTTGVTGIGSCGHQYGKRVPVPHQLSGFPKTDENMKRFRAFQKSSGKALTRVECPECLANQSLRESTGLLTEIALLYETEPFPNLDGSARMQAFANSVRSDYVSDILSSAHLEAVRLWAHPSISDQLVVEAITARWSSARVVAPSGDLADLARAVSQVGSERSPVGWVPDTDNDAQQFHTMIWLLGRRQLQAHRWKLAERRSKSWVTMRRLPILRDRLRPLDPSASDVFAAMILARSTGWPTRAELWAAFELASGFPALTLDALVADRQEMALPELMEELAVVRALTSAPQRLDLPF